MSKKFLFILIVLIFILKPVEASLITVCSSGCDSTTVQGGINLASNGDEVRIIDSGEYNENVIVNRSILLNSNATPLIWDDSTYHVVNISVNNVNISNLQIKYNGTDQKYGIYINRANYTKLFNNTVLTDYSYSDAIGLSRSYYNNISYNNITATGSFADGISCSIFCDYNNITYNNITTDSVEAYSISMGASDNNRISNNIMTGQVHAAVYILSSSVSNTISYNTIDLDPPGWGIYIYSNSNDNEISNNNITTSGSSGWGIYILQSDNINITSSNISAADDYDIYLSAGSNNIRILDTNYTDESVVVASDLRRLWYLDIYVNDTNGNPMNQANISAYDNYSTQSFSELTNSSGYITRKEVEEYNQTTSGKTYFTNYTINVTKTGLSTSTKQVNLTSTREIFLTMTLLVDGSSCTLASQCLNGYCVHNICRSTSTYCGDGYCDSGESCDICVSDCGKCPGEGPPPSPEVNILPPEEPTEFPETVIEIPDLPPLETPITLPEAGATIKLEPNFVLTLYPLTNLTAVIHNISKIEEPSKYKILLCNQTLISSYEIEITVDLAYFCANYSGYNVEDPTVNIFKFIEDEWVPLEAKDMAKNTIKKIICGKITSTPYMITGFAPTVDSQTALLAIESCDKTIITAKEQGIDVSKAEEFLEKAWFEYYSCNYAKAKELVDKALESLVVPPTWLIPISFAAVMIVAIAWFWYYTVRIKVRVKR